MADLLTPHCRGMCGQCLYEGQLLLNFCHILFNLSCTMNSCTDHADKNRIVVAMAKFLNSHTLCKKINVSELQAEEVY